MRLLPLVLFVSACSMSSAAPAHAPLVCDPDRAGEVVFLFHESDAFLSAYLPHGAFLLAIDGACGYHAYVAYGEPSVVGVPGVLRHGELDADTLAELNDTLLTLPFASYDGLRGGYEMSADSSIVTLQRGSYEATCEATCMGAEAVEPAMERSRAWLATLWERGVEVDGPVDVVAQRIEGATIGTPTEWTGTTVLFPEGTLGDARVRVDDDADVLSLRALRAAGAPSAYGPPIVVRESEAVIGIGVADVLPYAITLRSGRAGRPW
ncbi:MAG: hypothetical protein M3Y87_12895 [Myxococcota bacterium]|nr:hypothetical protein [Myxococcota bacterium]